MWDQRYDQDKFIYGKQANDFLAAQYHHIPQGGRVLCLAEGEGRNAVFLAQQGYQVTAVDLSQVGLDKAQKLAQEKGVEIHTQLADLAEFDLGQAQWHGIVSIWAHMPQTIREQLHRRVVEALKPQGIFLLEAYTIDHLALDGVGGPPASQSGSFMSCAQLKEELAPLTTLIAVEKQRQVNEGDMHYGNSAVVQFVARKDTI